MKQLEKRITDYMTTTFKSIGMQELAARVMSLLYLEPGYIAMDEVAKRTGYSLASISTTIKMMEGLGVLQRSRKPGTRKIYLYMEKDLAKLNISKIKVFQDKFVKRADVSMPEFIQKYKQEAKDKESIQRLHIIENYYAQLAEFGKLMNVWLRDLEKLSRKYSKKVV